MIECTQTYFCGGNSGIQRVARNIANHALDLEHPKREILPVIWVGYGFCEVRHKLTPQAHPLVQWRDWLRKKLQKKEPGPFLSILLRTLKTSIKIFRPLRTPFEWAKQAMLGFGIWVGYYVVRLLFGPYIKFEKGDAVLLIDATWGFPDMIDALQKARKNEGIKVAPMLHDLFPLTHPDTCEEITIKYYRRWFQQVVPIADFFITNSSSTETSLKMYLAEHPNLRKLPILSSPFRLGAELDLAHLPINNPEELSPLWGTAGRAILAIGTIEPRKNHMFLLDVFDILRTRGVNVSLILIGRVGWKSESVMERINQHPDLNNRLLHFSNANDRVLTEALERADCLVCCSIAEGFGLPVVEGLMRNKEVYASDIEVFREVAGDKCRYFNLSDPKDLADQLQASFAEKDQGIKRHSHETFQWLNWHESAEELIDVTMELLLKLRQRNQSSSDDSVESN